MTDHDKKRRIQSVEIAFSILRILSNHKRAMSLSELSNQTGLHKSQLYRYLYSFVQLGVLVRENGENPKWSLGPELIALGSAAHDGLDLVKEAMPHMLELRNQLNETIALSIWREHGPFFVHWEKSNKLVNIGLDTGSYVPLYTATGKIFRAYLPESMTNELYASEVSAGNIKPDEYALEIASVAKRGFSLTEGSLIVGIAAISTPIFYPQAKLAGALSVIGVAKMLDHSPESLALRELVKNGEKISRRLGYTGAYPLMQFYLERGE
ncbi:IclR family transcriptional regulator [Ferviditalea candida]|uniref:IclR family transcriptional regulator n=1 Tax=Ferviditalea candida TaxID=3108399 RepID=A0ABU5ZHY8_9BACL|nr:IclR family transcriptional regulator [Paenibacillaceae bacterium T2]